MANTALLAEMRFSSGPAGGQSVGAVTVDLATVNLSAILPGSGNIPIHCEGIVVAQDNSLGTCATGRVLQTAKYNGGALTLPSSATMLAAFSGDLVSAVSAGFAVSGTSLKLQGTGVGGVTINWWAFLRIWSAGFSG